MERFENKNLELEYRILGTGEKLLLIETGIGGSIYNWFSFVNKIFNDFTIIMYHRAGYGKSGVSRNPRTTEIISCELNNLIESIGIKEKIILIGHSFGGLCALNYALLFPEKVEGLLLLDSTSPNFNRLYNLDIPVMNSLISIDTMMKGNLANSYKSKEELRTIYKNSISDCYAKLPEEEAIEYEEFITDPKLFKTVADEFQNWEVNGKKIKALGKLTSLPLTVITRDIETSINAFIHYGIPREEAVKYEKVWRELQIELSHLSSQGEFIIADGSDHEVHIDKPKVVIQSLQRFL